MPFLRELYVYQDHAPRFAAMNMAVDEALLESASAPSLRFYRWQQPSLSFGYFGSFADAAAEGEDREIVRRWTGGGIVLHGTDLTYSVMLPGKSVRDLPPSRIVYAEIHEAIRVALVPHLSVALAAGDAPKMSQTCFANPVMADVMVKERKIAGAAQRRTRAGLLHQGSIQFEGLPGSFPEAFAAALCPEFQMRSFTAELLLRARNLAEEKYGTDEWLRQR